MAFKSLYEIKSQTVANRGGYVRKTGSELTIAVHKRGQTKSLVKKSLVFVIREPLMKKARYILGDKIDILFDSDDGVGLIRRVSEGGFTITRNGASDKHGRVSLPLIDGIPYVDKTSECESINITNEGVMFKLPKEFKILNEEK